MDKKRLLSGIRQMRENGGDQDAAFRIIYDESRGSVLATIRKYCDNKEAYEDILQETYLQVYRSIADLRDDDKALAWICRIAAHTAIRHDRKLNKQWQSTFSDMEDEEGNLPDFEDQTGTYNPEAVADRRAVSETVAQILDSLPHDQKIAMWMVYGQQVTIRELAAELEVSENTIKSRLYQGRNKLLARKAEFKKYGIELAAVPLAILISSAFEDTVYAAAAPLAGSMLINGISEAGNGKEAANLGVAESSHGAEAGTDIASKVHDAAENTVSASAQTAGQTTSVTAHTAAKTVTTSATKSSATAQTASASAQTATTAAKNTASAAKTASIIGKSKIVSALLTASTGVKAAVVAGAAVAVIGVGAAAVIGTGAAGTSTRSSSQPIAATEAHLEYMRPIELKVEAYNDRKYGLKETIETFYPSIAVDAAEYVLSKSDNPNDEMYQELWNDSTGNPANGLYVDDMEFDSRLGEDWKLSIEETSAEPVTGEELAKVQKKYEKPLQRDPRAELDSILSMHSEERKLLETKLKDMDVSEAMHVTVLLSGRGSKGWAQEEKEAIVVKIGDEWVLYQDKPQDFVWYLGFGSYKKTGEQEETVKESADDENTSYGLGALLEKSSSSSKDRTASNRNLAEDNEHGREVEKEQNTAAELAEGMSGELPDIQFKPYTDGSGDALDGHAYMLDSQLNIMMHCATAGGVPGEKLADAINAWSKRLYAGDWSRMIEIFSIYDDHYLPETELAGLGEIKFLFSAKKNGWFTDISAEQAEYLARAITGKQWEYNPEDIPESFIVNGEEISQPDCYEATKTEIDIYRPITDKAFPSFSDGSVEYLGNGEWTIKINVSKVDGFEHQTAEVTFTVKYNPDSCFDGFSVIGMNATDSNGNDERDEPSQANGKDGEETADNTESKSGTLPDIQLGPYTDVSADILNNDCVHIISQLWMMITCATADGVPEGDLADAINAWSKRLYAGDWSCMIEIFSNYSGPYWFETGLKGLEDVKRTYSEEDKIWVSNFSSEQAEYLARSITGKQWEYDLANIPESFMVNGEKISRPDYYEATSSGIDTYGSVTGLSTCEIIDDPSEYIGNGEWTVQFDVSSPERFEGQTAKVTFTVKYNPDSCFDGFSVIGMDATK